MKFNDAWDFKNKAAYYYGRAQGQRSELASPTRTPDSMSKKHYAWGFEHGRQLQAELKLRKLLG